MLLNQPTLSAVSRIGGRNIAPLAVAVLLITAAAAALVTTPRQGTQTGAASSAPLAMLQSRSLHFSEGPDGAATISDAAHGTQLARFGAGEGGFVRTSLRLMVVERRRLGADLAAPFKLTRWANGSLTLDDAAVGKTLELNAYGQTNASAFAALLETGRKLP